MIHEGDFRWMDTLEALEPTSNVKMKIDCKTTEQCEQRKYINHYYSMYFLFFSCEMLTDIDPFCWDRVSERETWNAVNVLCPISVLNKWQVWTIQWCTMWSYIFVVLIFSKNSFMRFHKLYLVKNLLFRLVQVLATANQIRERHVSHLKTQ